MIRENEMYLGDCIDYMKQIPDKHIDLVLTDPPYGMNFQSCYRKEKHDRIENDNNFDWISEFINQISRVAKD